MNTNSSLNKEQVDKVIDILKLNNEDAQTIFENATDVSCKRDPHVQHEINLSFANGNNARILIDASYPDSMEFFLDSGDKQKSFSTGEFTSQSDGYNFLQTKLKELSQLDGPVSQNKEYLLSTALRLDKDKISAFASEISNIKSLHNCLEMQLDNGMNIRLRAPYGLEHPSEYDISVSDGKNERIHLPTFSDNEYTFKVLEEIKDMPLSEIKENLQRFADDEKTLLLSKALNVDESTIAGFSHNIEYLNIYESQDSKSIRFRLEDKAISIETKGENYSLWIDGNLMDFYIDGKYVAADLEELAANKLEAEHKAETDFSVE